MVCPCAIGKACGLADATQMRSGAEVYRVDFWIPAPDRVEGRLCAGMTSEGPSAWLW
jgi:hypothetical protein